jgi:hypothetical protein
MAKKDKTKGKDLKPSKPVKGGKIAGNDNLTLVRMAKPQKGLPPSKDVDGGRSTRQHRQTFTPTRWRIRWATRT